MQVENGVITLQALSSAKKSSAVRITKENAVETVISFAQWMLGKKYITANKIAFTVANDRNGSGWLFQQEEVEVEILNKGKREKVKGPGKVYRVFFDKASKSYKAFGSGVPCTVNLNDNPNSFRLVLEVR